MVKDSSDNTLLSHDPSNTAVRNNKLVVADKRNNTIQLYDFLTGKLLDNLKLRNSCGYFTMRCRIAFVADDKAIVVYGRSAYSISVGRCLKLTKTVDCRDHLYDICFLRAGFFATVSNDCINFMDLSLNITKTIKGDEEKGLVFQKTRMITAISADTVVVLDAGNRTLFCIGREGNVVWHFVIDRIPEAVCNFQKFVIIGMRGGKILVLNSEDGENVGGGKLDNIYHIYDVSTFNEYIVITRRDIGRCTDMVVYTCGIDNMTRKQQIC